MNPILQCIQRAYRPLYMHGLWLDGQCRWPRTDPPAAPATSANRSRRRSLLVALAGLPHHRFQHRSTP